MLLLVGLQLMVANIYAASFRARVTSSDVDMAARGGAFFFNLFIVISVIYKKEHHGHSVNVFSMLEN